MSTIYIKILNDDGSAASVEELTAPVYVYKQPSNGLIARCIDTLAQGILDAKGEKIYQLEGKETVARAAATAVIITKAEYEELTATLGTDTGEDPEDITPEIPEDSEEEPMTRAELTAAVNQLSADQAALTAAIEKGLTL